MLCAELCPLKFICWSPNHIFLVGLLPSRTVRNSPVVPATVALGIHTNHKTLSELCSSLSHFHAIFDSRKCMAAPPWHPGHSGGWGWSRLPLWGYLSFICLNTLHSHLYSYPVLLYPPGKGARSCHTDSCFVSVVISDFVGGATWSRTSQHTNTVPNSLLLQSCNHSQVLWGLRGQVLEKWPLSTQKSFANLIVSSVKSKLLKFKDQ